LPDRSLGPLGGVNVRAVWIIAIVLALVSFVGYVCVKLFGDRRGALLAGAAGGLISSTAVMLASSRRVAAGEASAGISAASAMLATGVSFVRVAVVVSALSPDLIGLTAPPMAAGALVAGGLALGAGRFGSGAIEPANAPIQFRNPFGFWYVLGMALSMAALIVVGRLLYGWFGTRGVYAGAAAMGLFDVDSMTVSITRLAPQLADHRIAAGAILAGVVSNTVAKVAIAAVIAPRGFAVRVGFVSFACLLVGGVVFAVVLRLS